MAEYVVSKAERKVKRDINKVFTSNLFKILTEIILNSDDSYKRLEKEQGVHGVKKIIIDINRSKKAVEIIDYAEGLSGEDLRRIFTMYGAMHNSNEEEVVRGLFGQGASDVLFFGASNARLGEIMSIKDGVMYKCKFIVDKEQKIKIDTITHKNRVREFKKKYGVETNGTVVRFGLGDKVTIPHKNALKEKLEQFYMLRYVLSDDRREVILKHDRIKTVLSAKKLIPKEEDCLVENKAITFDFDGKTFDGSLSLYRDSNQDKDDKILVIDEGLRVYDNTYFIHDDAAGIHNIKGVLLIPGLYEVLSEYLNQPYPEEILRDSRDGFDQRNTFTHNLFRACKGIVEREVVKLNQSVEPKRFSFENDKHIKKALKKINEYYKALELEEIGNVDAGSEPPSEGVKFIRTQVFMTKGKQYALKVLINAHMIPRNTPLKVSHQDSQCLDVITQSLSYKEEDVSELGLVVKNVILKANDVTVHPLELTVSALSYESKASISVVEEEVIYPENGLEFRPKSKRIRPSKGYTLKLYVDTFRFPYGSEIFIRRTTRSELFPDEGLFAVSESDQVHEDLACIKIPFAGGAVGEHHHFEAMCEGVKTKCVVRVEEKQDKPDGFDGIFSAIEAVERPFEDWQSAYEKNTGIIKINLAHPINKKMLVGITADSLKRLDLEEGQYAYIFELVAFECAKQMLYIKQSKESVEIDASQLLSDLQAMKSMLFKSILNV